jgi:hypothetical protein
MKAGFVELIKSKRELERERERDDLGYRCIRKQMPERSSLIHKKKRIEKSRLNQFTNENRFANQFVIRRLQVLNSRTVSRRGGNNKMAANSALTFIS